MSGARFIEVYRLELRRNATRPLTWVLLVLLGFLAKELSGGNASIGSGNSAVGGVKAWITSEFALSQLLAILTTVCYGFFVSVAAGLAVAGDDDHKVGELLHATPLRPSEYVWGKFLGVLTAFFGVLALHLALAAFFNHALPKGDRGDILGPFALAHYLRPAIVFAVPTMVLMAGAAFALGTLTRKPILVFLLPVAAVLGGAFFLWEWSPVWLDPRLNHVLMLLDPSGQRWLSETWMKVDRGVAFYNTRPVPLEGSFVVMRFVWLALGLGLVWFTERRFAATLRGRAAVRAKRGTDTAAANGAAYGTPAVAPRPLGALGMTSGAGTFVTGLLEVLRVELRELASQPGLYLFVPMILIQVFGSVVETGAFDTTLLSTPGLLAVRQLDTLTLLLCLLLLFYTVESLQRERGTGVASIGWATPLRTGALLLGKALANAVVGVVVILACLAGAALVLLVQGRVPMHFGPFAIVWGLLLVPTLLAWTSFVTLGYAATGNRFTTYGLGLAALVVTGVMQMRGHMNWVGNWDLWKAVRWTDMGVFELDRTAIVLNRLEVLGLALLFTAITARVFPRREHDATRIVQRLQPAALGRTALGLAPFALVPLVAGSALYLQVQNGWQGKAQEKAQLEYWKRNVRTWDEAPLPAMAGVDLDVALEPAKRWYRVSGSYALTNTNAAPLKQIPLTGGFTWDSLAWTLDGRAVTPDDRSHLYVFTPPHPLQRGDTLRIGFRYTGTYPPGVSRNGGAWQQFVLPSGVVLTGFEKPSWVPTLGFDPEIGILDDKKNKAEPRVYPDSFWVGDTHATLAMAEHYFPTRIRVTGPKDYTYNATGVLESDVVHGDRRTSLWVSDHPVRIFNLCAGRWAVKRAPGVAVYYDPRHSYNVDEMLHALAESRRWYSQWFCPYPWRDLRLSEFPALADYAQGSPTNITFSENIGFLTKSEPKADAAFWITGHEAAHQWWGNIVLHAAGPGTECLSEGMAQFSTMLLTDQVQGPAGGRAFRRMCEKRYATGRRNDAERPLTQVDVSRDGDRRLIYERAGWVFWMMQDLMGKSASIDGLHDFVRTWRDTTDHPVLQEYLSLMRRHAPDPVAYDSLVTQWALGTALPEYKLSEIHRVHAGGGWAVTATVRNDGTGRMPLEVAAANIDREDGQGRDQRDYRDARTRVVLGAGESRTFTIHTPFEPKRLVVDPDVRVLQLRREKAQAWL